MSIRFEKSVPIFEIIGYYSYDYHSSHTPRIDIRRKYVGAYLFLDILN